MLPRLCVLGHEENFALLLVPNLADEFVKQVAFVMLMLAFG